MYEVACRGIRCYTVQVQVMQISVYLTDLRDLMSYRRSLCLQVVTEIANDWLFTELNTNS